jgi:gamma-glutamylcyclotransferase
MIYYFAYGSNMNFERLKIRDSSASRLGSAFLEGYELVFNKIAKNKQGVSYANIQENFNSNVEGILYSLDNLDLLDKFEGFPKEYFRKEIEIIFENKMLKTWTYIANKDKTGIDIFPEKEYLNHILCGEPFLSKSYFKLISNIKTFD